MFRRWPIAGIDLQPTPLVLAEGYPVGAADVLLVFVLIPLHVPVDLDRGVLTLRVVKADKAAEQKAKQCKILLECLDFIAVLGLLHISDGQSEHKAAAIMTGSAF